MDRLVIRKNRTKKRNYASSSKRVFVIKSEKKDDNNNNARILTTRKKNTMLYFILVFVSFLYITSRLYKYFFPSPNIDPTGKYVLITGCSSGFGYALAVELDKRGFNVFAGVRNLQKASSLQEQLSSRSLVFTLDITKQDDIDAAYTMIKKQTNTLHALVNNAGMSKNGYIDWMTMDLMRQHMDVNFFGHVAMTKTFLPLLIAKRDSRVVNVSSIAGFISFGTGAAYSSAKYALESFSDCLRREMGPWGLRVSIIEPGAMKTSFFSEQEISWNKLWNESSSDVRQRWGDEFSNNLLRVMVDNPMVKYAENPLITVRDIEHAVMNINPRIRYRSGWQAKLMFILHTLPAWLVDQIVLSGIANLIPAGMCDQPTD